MQNLIDFNLMKVFYHFIFFKENFHKVIQSFGLLAEQLLKRAILHRKNSLFYKTETGAYVGDLFMSIIHTCSLCKANPFLYLKALQENSSLIAGSP